MTTSCWDIKQTAAYLGWSTKTVYRKLQAGQLPARKLGTWRIDSVKLRQMFESQPSQTA